MIPSENATSDAAAWLSADLDSSTFSELRKKHIKSTTYQSEYVEMRDGVKLAVDVILPQAAKTSVVPVVMIQCRYMRGMGIRWPLSILTGGQPLNLIHSETVMRLSAAGYAVVLYDIRGTGASFGAWRSLWGPEEQEDAHQMLDWITAQSWSSGKVALYGMSYEAGSALFTLAKHHPSVQCAVMLYPFWDLYTDISCRGGVPHKRFTEHWDNVCKNLDANRISAIGRIMQVLFHGTQPVVGTQWPSDSVLSHQYWSGIWRYGLQRSQGFSELTTAVKSHNNFSALKAMETLRFADQVDDQNGLPVWQASQCHKAREIAESGTKMLLLAGWLDATASAAISAFHHTAGPGSSLIIGPWTHTGFLDNSVGHRKVGTRSQFKKAQTIIDFIGESFEGKSSSSKPDILHAVSYYRMGHQPSWQHCDSWPPSHIGNAKYSLSLAGKDSLSSEEPVEQRTVRHVIQRGQHPEGHSRYDCMTNMTEPLNYTKLDSCGHTIFTSRPLQSAFEVTGYVELRLSISSNAKDVDIFCYLESVDPNSGNVAYITEGCFRASHRRISKDSSSPRWKAAPSGLPFHSFTKADAEDLEPGKFVKCHFTLLPTSFCFAPGHCIRLAISGCDTKHFYEDFHCDGSRSLLIQTGGESTSIIVFPSPDSPRFLT